MQQINLGNLPALGWNSWNTFTDKINETLILETADAMKKETMYIIFFPNSALKHPAIIK